MPKPLSLRISRALDHASDEGALAPGQHAYYPANVLLIPVAATIRVVLVVVHVGVRRLKFRTETEGSEDVRQVLGGDLLNALEQGACRGPRHPGGAPSTTSRGWTALTLPTVTSKKYLPRSGSGMLSICVIRRVLAIQAVPRARNLIRPRCSNR